MRKWKAVLAGALLAAGLVSAPMAAQAAVSSPAQPIRAAHAVAPSGSDKPSDAVLQKNPVHTKAAAGGTIKGDNGLRLRDPRLKNRVQAKATTSCGAVFQNACYHYGGADQSFPGGDEATMVNAQVRVDNPYLNRTVNSPNGLDSHSLAELWASRVNAAQTSYNAVEIGWTKDLGVCGTSNDLCLFVFSWTNGAGAGYNSANTNWVPATCSNTAPYTTNPPCVGTADISSWIGTTHNMRIEYFGAGCGCTQGWWYKVDGLWLGVMQATQWTSVSENFVDMDLFQTFGEIAGNYNTSTGVQDYPSCTDMGSGTIAGTSGDGNVNTVTYGGTTQSTSLTLNPDPQTAEWNVVSYGGATPVTGIRYGGPGFNSIGTAAGAKGSCAPATAGTPNNTLVLWSEECPDNNGSTGCTNGYNTSASCSPAPCTISGALNGVYKTWQNTSTSGKSFSVGRTSACTGTQLTLAPNGSGTAKGVLPSGWDWENIKCIRRIA